MRNEADGINWTEFNFSRAVASFPHLRGRLDYDYKKTTQGHPKTVSFLNTFKTLFRLLWARLDLKKCI